MSRFKIEAISDSYVPKEKSEPEQMLNTELTAKLDKGHDKSRKIYLTPQSVTQIFTHIGWGTKTKQNVVEQGGILIGEVLFDPKTKTQYGIVREAIAGKQARGTSAYLEMNHAVWKAMVDRADEIIDARPEDNWQIIGWYHTHPNDLSVFFSATDLGTQRTVFREPWHYALVFNPHKKIWKAFYGENAHPCVGLTLGKAEK
ncbi:MAG: Mov34/MPN/PAD-1 family protein [Bacteroidota bacterium]